MTEPDNTSGTDAPNDGRENEESDVIAFTLDDRTVLFDSDDAARWLVSDASVDLSDAV